MTRIEYGSELLEKVHIEKFVTATACTGGRAPGLPQGMCDAVGLKTGPACAWGAWGRVPPRHPTPNSACKSVGQGVGLGSKVPCPSCLVKAVTPPPSQIHMHTHVHTKYVTNPSYWCSSDTGTRLQSLCTHTQARVVRVMMTIQGRAIGRESLLPAALTDHCRSLITIGARLDERPIFTTP